MPRLEVNLTRNGSLSITLICEILGISKSEFLRMALLKYIVEILEKSNLSDTDKKYIHSLLLSSINELSDLELNAKFKQEILKALLLIN
jgi:hypothetical protein